MTRLALSVFTKRINSLLPLDNNENVSKLIRIIARQIKKSEFRFNLDKLELDLSNWTTEEFKPRLVSFFNRARANVKVANGSTERLGKASQRAKKQRKHEKNQIKNNKSLSPTKALPVVPGVPESLIRKSIKNEEKRKKRTLNKKEILKSGKPKRASWNEERIVVGIYQPSTLHSETDEDPIHRK